MTVKVLRGRGRTLLKKNEIKLAAISVMYLVLIFLTIVLEEMPFAKSADCGPAVGPSTLDQAIQIADMAFLVFFMIELSVHMLVDGWAYLAASKLHMLDALTVVISFVVAVLSFTGMINTRLAIMRLFRLLRLVKVALAVQRVKARTQKWSKRGQELMHLPPTCNWSHLGTSAACSKHKPRPGERETKYAAFLSHFKFEAGADARFLEQQLERMLKADVFVDSNDLTDLTKIFSEGVLKSEMVIVLGTAGLLTRPWCLLELYTARKHNVPVITFALAHHHYTPASARAQIECLETKLPPDAVRLIMEHLEQEGDSWQAFIGYLLDAVDASGSGRSGPPMYQEWHSMGADAQVNVEIRGLITSMAMVTERTLQWNESACSPVAEADPDPLGKQILDSLLCRRKPKPKMYGAYAAFAAEDVSVARVLQGELQEQLEKPVMLSGRWRETYTELRGPTEDEKRGKDRGELEELNDAAVAAAAEKLEEALECGVAQADCLLVLLTKHTLRDPFLLCEVFSALERGVNVVPVAVAGHGWDFMAAPDAIKAAPERLRQDDPALYEAAVEVFANRGIAMGNIQATLAKLPKLIAVTLPLSQRVGATTADAPGYTASAVHDLHAVRSASEEADPIEVVEQRSESDFGLKASIAAIASRCRPKRASG